jgi:hypothetical protein
MTRDQARAVAIAIRQLAKAEARLDRQKFPGAGNSETELEALVQALVLALEQFSTQSTAFNIPATVVDKSL